MKTFKTIILVLAVAVTFAVSAFAQTKELKLNALDAESVDIRGTGKVTVLAIGATWLPLTQQQIIFANKLKKKYALKSVDFFFVATDSTAAKSKNFATVDKIKTFVTENKITFQTVRDSDGFQSIKAFGIDQLPSFVILDKNGEQIGEALSGIDESFDITVPMSKTIDSLLVKK